MTSGMFSPSLIFNYGKGITGLPSVGRNRRPLSQAIESLINACIPGLPGNYCYWTLIERLRGFYTLSEARRRGIFRRHCVKDRQSAR